ncbi:GATA zinc finger domain-containing protein 4-like [Leptopilina boulardi]|uniref:GATA zinc finger domain-containing protein 4-like n=1 Tax=Leptopilina boulardi TaxID=63433 RepID=UPI0021F58000|nr:GATA zinc finger domain-containing protein 4-like [Leptopilina boulardi]
MSEKRKSSDSPQSTKSRFKLKSKKRSSSTEENTFDNGDTTPKRYNAHSTPIRNSNILSTQEDSPEMCQRASPISNTQKNEVCWSWHSQKDELSTKNDLKTPKRSLKLQKRRMPDSPKMFTLTNKIRVKTKGSNLNQAEFRANFEEFRAILTNRQQQQKQEEIITDNKPSTSSTTTLIDSISSKIENIDNNKEQIIDNEQIEIKNKSELKLVYSDDYDLDESLVRCSQLCEEEFFAKITNEEKIVNSSTPLIKIKNKGSHIHNSPISGLENLIKIPIETPPCKLINNKLTTIADDSFDEYLSQLKDEDLTNIKNSPISSRSASKKSLFTNNNLENKKLITVKSCSILDDKIQQNTNDNRFMQKTKSFDSQSKIYTKQQTNIMEINKFVPKTKSFDIQTKIYPSTSKILFQEKILKQQQQPPLPPIESSPRKFFKTKCNSEPLAKSPKLSTIPIKNYPDVPISNVSTNNDTKITGKSFQCKIYSDSCFSQNNTTSSGFISNGSNNSSSSSGGSNNNYKINSSSENRPINQINNNNNINNVSNNFPNITLSTHRSMDELHIQSKKVSQVTLFTAEQIEKKRLEAKMKLAAKRQIINSKHPSSTTTTTTTTTTRILPLASSVKR